MMLENEAGAWAKLLQIDTPIAYKGQDALRRTLFDIVNGMVRVRSRRAVDGLAPRAPEAWPDVVAKAWPTIWTKPPHKIPDGWCDLVVVMSGELARTAPDAQVVDAFEDHVQATLSLRIAGDARVGELPYIYAHVSSHVCRECGSPAKIRRVNLGTWALCGGCKPKGIS